MKYKKTAIVILVLLTILFVILILLGRFYYEKAGEYLELAQAAPLYSEARDSNYDYMFALQEKSSGF